jgi:hypothetical protein
MKIFLSVLVMLAISCFCFTSAYAASAETRTATAKGLTSKYKAEGFPVTFEAIGKNKSVIKITQNNITQNPPLTEGQIITMLGTYLKDGIQSRLINEGFVSGVVVDGKSREYPFGL